jgi:hypothetical protein
MRENRRAQAESEVEGRLWRCFLVCLVCAFGTERSSGWVHVEDVSIAVEDGGWGSIDKAPDAPRKRNRSLLLETRQQSIHTLQDGHRVPLQSLHHFELEQRPAEASLLDCPREHPPQDQSIRRAPCRQSQEQQGLRQGRYAIRTASGGRRCLFQRALQ